MNNQLIISSPNSNSSSQKKKKNQNQKKPKKSQSKTTSQKPQLRPRAHLSECARLYAAALTNPWACPSPPCVPDEKITPSYKFSVRGKGSFSVGNAGVGFVAFAPKAFGNNLAGDNCSVFYTSGAAFLGNTITCLAATAGVNEQVLGRFPYTVAQMSDALSGLQVRLVGSGLRVFYTGTELNRSGLIQMFRHPQNASTHTYDTNDLYALSNTKGVPCDRRKHAVTWQPVTSNDTDYIATANNVARSTATAATGACCMGAFISGAVASNSFEYEIISHYEMLGTPILTTKSHSDSVGYSAIMTSLPRVIETISNVYQGDLLSGALSAIEAASGLYFGPPAPREKIPVISNYHVEDL